MNQHDLMRKVVLEYKKTVDQGEPDEGLRARLIEDIDGRYGDVVDRQLTERIFEQAVEEYAAFLEFGEILNNFKDLIKDNGPGFMANILFNQGAAYEGIGKKDLAIETYQKALGQEDMTQQMVTAINYNLGTLLAGRRNFRKAQVHLLKAQETGINHPGLRQNLDYVARQLDFIEENTGPNQTLEQARKIQMKIYGRTPCG